MDAFFVDYSLAPLMMHENYVRSAQNKISRGVTNPPPHERLASASAAVSDLDLIDTKLRQNQNYSLLTTEAALSVRIGRLSGGQIGCACARRTHDARTLRRVLLSSRHARSNASFPAWFGKNSTRGKFRRLSSELAVHLAASARGIGGQEALRLDMLEVRRMIARRADSCLTHPRACSLCADTSANPLLRL